MLRLMLSPNTESLQGFVSTSIVCCGKRLSGFDLFYPVAHDYTFCSTLPRHNVIGLFP
jgi:hypothetical protein